MLLFLLILVLSFLLQLLLPWWIIAPVAFICCFLKARKTGQAFLISFLAIFILWLIACVILSSQNDHILSTRVAQMLGLGSSTYSWLLVATISSLLGGIVAGIAGISGFLLRRLSSQKY